MGLLNFLGSGKKTVVKPMNICMLGARGVGKTSVITSMYYGQKEAVSGTDLFLIASGDTSTILNNKKLCLEAMFTGFHEADSRVTEPGIAGSYTESMFDFTYGMNSQKIDIGMEIRDYPGEYLISSPDVVSAYIQKASAVLIAIDTPCMMEEGGRYNAGKNNPKLIMDFLMKNLSNESCKLILFVPLKCEKYYEENRINEVTAAVERNYADMLEYFRDRENQHGFKEKICCAVTPIRTLGSVVFDDFERDSNGKVAEMTLKDGRILPVQAHYRYLHVQSKYEPVDCAQPLYFLLAFFSKQYQAMQQAKGNQGILGLFNKLRDMLRLIPNANIFLLEVAKMGMRRHNEGGGYKILFGRGRV